MGAVPSAGTDPSQDLPQQLSVHMGSFIQQVLIEHLLQDEQDINKPLTSWNLAQLETDKVRSTDLKQFQVWGEILRKEGAESDDK